MDVTSLYAVISVADVPSAEGFYTALLGRAPDDRPMDGLIQWRLAGGAGLQVVRDAEKAGSSLLTIITPDMAAARTALGEAGLELGPDIKGTYGVIAHLDDPDGNRVTLAEPPMGLTG